MGSVNRVKLVISDCHLSAGLNFESERNPHEDFVFDDELVSFFSYFSSGPYGFGCEVELILNGDFLDFLNVPYRGEFEEVITEQFALYKLECILAGHPRVIAALRKFAGQPGKTVTYNVGNHDAEFFFPKVREYFVRAIDPEEKFPSDKAHVNFEKPSLDVEGGIQIHHGHLYEAAHYFDYENPIFVAEGLPLPVLNLPWGSFYVLKIVNRFKWEREYVDKVRPVKAMILWGLVFDTWFTLKFLFLSLFYFLKTRFIYSSDPKRRLQTTFKILKEETTTFLQDLEKSARELLRAQPEVHTVIMGHTHHPMFKVYPDGKCYLNTGTWTKMINLDLRSIGTATKLTFALIEYDEQGKARARLQQWMGEFTPHRSVT